MNGSGARKRGLGRRRSRYDRGTVEAIGVLLMVSMALLLVVTMGVFVLNAG